MQTISYRKLYSSLFYFLGHDKGKFIFWNIPIIFSNIFALIQPLIIGAIIDFFNKYSLEQSLKQFYIYLGVFLIGSIISEIMRLSAKNKMFEISADLEFNIKTRGFDNIQNNALSWQFKESSGNKLQQIETGKDALLNLIDFTKNDLFYILINIIGILSVFSVINISLLFFFLIYTLLCLLLIRFWNKKNPEMLLQINKAKERSTGKLFEGLNNISTIKSLGATKGFQSAINNSQDELRLSVKIWERLGIYKWFSISALNLIFLTGFFLIVGYGVVYKLITVGLIFVLYTYFDQLLTITTSINNKVSNISEIKAKVERMLPLFENHSLNQGENDFPLEWNEIEIKDASFEYSIDRNNLLFKDINFKVKKGEFIGIIGESGSGKSSFLKILLGLYFIRSGKYEIDGSNFYTIRSEEVLNNLTVVLQETELFNISLLENITMFKDVNLDLLEKAIEISQLKAVIEELPEGINTIIGEKGLILSGGQRQRIGIARAIYKNSPILLLDEATSNLDLATEKIVMNNILHELKGKTIIAVAHRLSTLEGVDYIYKFENGNLIKIKNL